VSLGNNYTIGIIKCDALRRGAYGPIMDRIADHAYLLIYHQSVIKFTKDIFHELHGSSYAVPDEGYASLMQPNGCVGLVLKSTNTNSAVQMFLDMIGHPLTPRNAIPGTLRHDFGGVGWDDAVYGAPSPLMAARGLMTLFPALLR